jgi:hypothetical protein
MSGEAALLCPLPTWLAEGEGDALKRGGSAEIARTLIILGHTMYLEDQHGDTVGLAGDFLLLNEPIEFIKLDVEGMEMDILAELNQTVRRWRPKMFVEVWEDRCATFMDWCESQS